MKKLLVAASIFLIIGLLISIGCSTNTATPTPNPPPTPIPTPAPTLPPDSNQQPTQVSEWKPAASLEDIKYDPNTPDNILISGKRTFNSSCAACHDLPTTTRITEFTSNKEMIELAIPMSEQAGLTLEYAEKVIRYMLAIRHGTAP